MIELKQHFIDSIKSWANINTKYIFFQKQYKKVIVIQKQDIISKLYIKN